MIKEIVESETKVQVIKYTLFSWLEFYRFRIFAGDDGWYTHYELCAFGIGIYIFRFPAFL